MTSTLTLFRPTPADGGKRRRPVSRSRPGRALPLFPESAPPPAGREPESLREPLLPTGPDAASLPTGGGPTLDDLIVGSWEGLTAHRTISCPVCGGAMAPRYGAGAGAVGGRCGDCRSTLA